MDTAEILKRVRRIEIETGKLVKETFAGEYLSIFKGQGIEFAEVRQYIPGDDVRSIDWNVSAKTGGVFVKKFNEERELTLLIACDVSASLMFGSLGRLKSEIHTFFSHHLFSHTTLFFDEKSLWQYLFIYL